MSQWVRKLNVKSKLAVLGKYLVDHETLRQNNEIFRSPFGRVIRVLVSI